MGGSLKGSTTVKQSNEPPKWAAPLFQQSASVAQDLFNSGVGFNIWPGATVAEPSAMTQAGAQGLADVATSPDSYALSQYPVQLANQAISQGGLMAPGQEAMSFFGNVTEGDYNNPVNQFMRLLGSASGIGSSADPTLDRITQGQARIGTGGDYRDIYGRAQQPGAAENYLTETARGDYLEEGNPYFRQWLEREAERIGDQVSGQFSAAGRYGSGAHQGVLGDTVGDFTLQGLAEDFARERGLQMDAARTIEAAQQGRLDQQLAAMTGQTGVQAENIANRLRSALAQRGFAGEDWQRELTAAKDLFGARQQNFANQFAGAQSAADLSNQGLMNALGFIGAMPTIQQNRTFAPQLQMQAGAVQDQYNQQLINDMISKFYQQDMQPWTQLGALQAAASGAAGPYGMAYQKQQQNPGLLSVLGDVASIFAGMPAG